MRDELSVLSAFLAVAEERSFTRAAKQLNISTSGLSHAIRRLEEQIGVRLLTRTTRSVSPTDAGEQLLAHLRPALADIRGTLTNLSGLQTEAGRTRPVAVSAARREDGAGAQTRSRSRATTRTWSSTSRPTTAASTWCRRASTQASSSASTSRRTWWPSASRRISAPRSSAHRRTSSRTPSRRLRETCCNIDASASATGARASTVGIRQGRPVAGDRRQRVAACSMIWTW